MITWFLSHLSLILWSAVGFGLVTFVVYRLRLQQVKHDQANLRVINELYDFYGLKPAMSADPSGYPGPPRPDEVILIYQAYRQLKSRRRLDLLHPAVCSWIEQLPHPVGRRSLAAV